MKKLKINIDSILEFLVDIIEAFIAALAELLSGLDD